MIFLLTLPIRILGLGYRAGSLSAKATRRTVRFVGYRRVALLLVGIAIGLLLAPVPGAELRARLRKQLSQLGPATPLELGDRIREELAASPRTWHLPQPGISVADGVVVLSGDVPHATASADLERTVREVKGVVDVDNRLTVPSR
jgi:hypothetical protein